MKSPLRYPGGKSKLLKQILKFKPTNVKEYREPFLGGGSLFFHLLDDKSIEVFKASDTFPELINFYQAMLESPPELFSSVQHFKMTYGAHDLFTTCKELIANAETGAVDRAAAFFVLNRITFSGLTLSGGFSKASYEGRFNKSHMEKVKNFENLNASIDIRERSYETLLHEESSRSVWIFLDPPYDIKSDNLYGKNGAGHKGFDHVKLAEECKECKHPFLITYNDNETIRKLYQDWAYIHEVDVIYSMNSSAKRKKELFITNYKVEQ